MSSNNLTATMLNAKDFASDQEIRWCPGCGDYAILKQVQTVLAKIGTPKENIVIVSGIGCSSRFPYYMNTYGIHTIHGRSTTVASGLKIANPDVSVWVVTGDGDSLSIGLNHFVHTLRRNININLLLFNNEIYGLTKGQYSPTSKKGIITKSSPYGSLDTPLNPISLALGAEATFIARSIDRNLSHLREMLFCADTHIGTSFLEIYQNCLIFNDKVFDDFTNKEHKHKNAIFLAHNKPLVFGEENEQGILLDGVKPSVVNLKERDISENDLWIHDEADKNKAYMLSRFSDVSEESSCNLPRPFGIFYSAQRPCYENQIDEQIKDYTSKFGEGNLDNLLRGNDTWEVKA